MKTVTLVADDRVGLLMDISTVLAQARINIETVNADAHAGKAIVVLTLSDAEKGRRALEGAGYKIEASDRVVIELPDRPGELSRVTSMLSKEGIGIDSVHTIAKDGKKTVLSLKIKDHKKATSLLKEYIIAAGAD